MTAPFTFASGTGSGTAPSFNVTTATAANDALVVSVLVAGANVTSVSDSKGNTYTQESNPASSNTWVFAATGSTIPLVAGATPDTVTVHLSASASVAVIGTDCPGTATVDVNTSASGTSAAPSVTGTPGHSSETALAVYAWGNAGGAGSISSPFTQLTQVTGGGPYLTTAYDLNPASGAGLTAAASISSASWTVILLTFQTTAAVAPFTQPHRAAVTRTVPRHGSAKGSSGAPVSAVVQVPSPFYPPNSAIRGQQGRKGSSRGAAGAPISILPTFPAPFYPPHAAVRGRRAAGRGTAKGSTGAPVTTGIVQHPAPFTAPHAAVRGRMAKARGHARGSAGAPVLPVSGPASGGAGRPQAYPGTSQVAVAAPGSSAWYYLGSIGQVTALTYSFNCPGGCDQMTCTVMVPASYRSQLFNPGDQVRITRGGHTVWTGVLDEPVPTASGWNLAAAGTGALGANFVAYYTDTWPVNEPDESINNAISRGLPWTNPGVGQPPGAWFGQAVDPGAQTIAALLNLMCTRGGLVWYVNSQPGGPIGNDLSVFPLPSTPSRLLVCTTPVPRSLAGAVRSIFIRYEISADTTDSSGNTTPAAYGLVSVSNSAAQAYGASATEQYIDLSNAGVMTAGQATQVGAYILEIYQQISFAGPFTVNYGQLLNMGGTPVDPGADQAGTVVRLILTDFAFGGSVIPQPVTFIVGSYKWDDIAQTATITPYQTLNTSLTGLLSLENTLLTPIQIALG